MLLFPHCDLHVTVNGPGHELALRVMRRVTLGDPDVPARYVLVPVPFASLRYAFFAPHNEPRHRFDNLPTVRAGADANTALVTANTPGVYLFSVELGRTYLVGRLQVHNQMVAWWFGMDSVTTAVDTIGHAQPSVYAKFSDDPSGADLIGDITGHGYVPLQSTNPARVVVTPEQRLRGVAVTPEPANPNDPDDPNVLPLVSGTLLGQTDSIPVRVVDYTTARRDLVPLRAPGVDQFADRHNLVFVAEGFRAEDRALFDQIVERATSDMFGKPRHQPYGLLEKSFNVFKAFAPSRERAVTVGFRVTDGQPPLKPGVPIPFDSAVSAGRYTLEELVAIVGLPMRNEQRANLPALWARSDLPNFQPGRVDPLLVEAWKTHQSVGILQAHDTFFGLHIGRRLADRTSRTGDPTPPPAGGDVEGDPALRRFIARLHEFYIDLEAPARSLRNDPRRHPPELYATADRTNALNSVSRYLGGLQYSITPFQPVGQSWAPDDRVFQRSRGLVAMVALDNFHCGTNINNSSATALSVNSNDLVSFEYRNLRPHQANVPDQREMRRTPGDIKPSFGDVVDKVAHELGHSFNLLDEYEDFGGRPDSDAQVTVDIDGDNVAMLGFIHRQEPGRENEIDPDRVKWLGLPRMRVSSRLLAPTTRIAAGLLVTVDPTDLAQWVYGQEDIAGFIAIRNFNIGAPPNRQLPLSTSADQIITGLSIVGEIDEAAGTFVLTGPSLPAQAPVFGTGSVVYVQAVNSFGVPKVAVEQPVLAYLRSASRPLNIDPNTDEPKTEPDDPVDIPGFEHKTCKGFRTIGVYEGAVHFARGRYRPAGACKMRASGGEDEAGEFCFVCKWLIVNRVDAGMHRFLDERFYPKAKQNEDD